MLPRRSRRPPPAPLADFVMFLAAGRSFALSTRQVVAVAELSALTPLRAAGRPDVLGLVAHRGSALPLIDLESRLGRSNGRPSPGPQCVVVEWGGRRAAFPVDELQGLARVPADGGLPPGCETFDPARVIFADEGEGP
jgi:chemotaxis signal transduction protein